MRLDADATQVLGNFEQFRCLQARSHGLANVDGARNYRSINGRADARAFEIDLRLCELGFALRNVGLCVLQLGPGNCNVRLGDLEIAQSVVEGCGGGNAFVRQGALSAQESLGVALYGFRLGEA